MKKTILSLLTILSVTPLFAQESDNTERLWYDTPASIWLEALPIGNGRLGGMVYGGPQSDEIQLNEDSFWSGGPHNNNSTTSKASLEQVRNLIFNGKEQQAEHDDCSWQIRPQRKWRHAPTCSQFDGKCHDGAAPSRFRTS
jgi:alpha-L-fucosidase 2